MDGENNGKPYYNSWFGMIWGGFPSILGNTQVIEQQSDVFLSLILGLVRKKPTNRIEFGSRDFSPSQKGHKELPGIDAFKNKIWLFFETI